MPYPSEKEKKSGEKGKKKYMDRCFHMLKKEGKPETQRIAMCLNMWKEGLKRKKTKGSDEPLDFDEYHDLGIATFIP